MGSIERTAPRANAAWHPVDGAITMVAADDPVEVARRRDVVAKRARDENLSDEADARGWSSTIPERSLALRRRRGSASPPFARATTSSVESFSPELASSAAATVCLETSFPLARELCAHYDTTQSRQLLCNSIYDFAFI
jgi:hypothetical protein